MPHYIVHIVLDAHMGLRTGTVRTATRGSIWEAPEGEFKDLPRSAYSVLKKSVPKKPAPGDPEEPETHNDGAIAPETT